MKKSNLLLIMAGLIMIAIQMAGCDGGGGSSSNSGGSTSTSSIAVADVSPMVFDFGTVTIGNESFVEITITNNGPVDLVVYSMSLSDTDNFSLNADANVSPCGSLTPTIAPNETCSVQVIFHPQSAAVFSATLTVDSNDPNTPKEIALSGEGDTVTALSAQINQISKNCADYTVSVYVSVTDQEGFPVTNLTEDNFSVSEDGTSMAIIDSDIAPEVTTPAAVALVMDYSRSMTAKAISDMEGAAKNFIDLLDENLGEEAEIIKFSNTVEIVQGFTSDKTLLKAAVDAKIDFLGGTRLHDAVYQAVADAEKKLDARRAVIVLTDGNDEGDSNLTLDEVISDAAERGVPVFAIGLGEDIDIDTLNRLADETGGQSYSAPDSAALQAIYSQISEILENQYVLTYVSNLFGEITGTVEVTVSGYNELPEVSDSKKFTACP